MKPGFRLSAGSVTRSEIDHYADQRELERLRRTIARELATHHGQEALAREIGVSRIVLRRFLAYSTPLPRHLQKIRDWAEDRPPVWVPFGAVLLATAIAGLPAPERTRVRCDLVGALAAGFRRSERALPGWLQEELAPDRVCPRPSPTS